MSLEETTSRTNAFALMGRRVILGFESFLAMFQFIGCIFLALPKTIIRPRRFNFQFTHDLFLDYGPVSLFFIVTANALAIGLVATISGSFLKLLKSEIHIVDFMLVGLTRGITPLLVAFIMLMRAGSTTTTAIYQSTLESLKEIAKYEFWPRVIALCLAMPMLYVYAFLISVSVGAWLGESFFNIPMTRYITQFINFFNQSYFFTSILLTIIFGFEIILLSSFYGYFYRKKNLDIGEALAVNLVTSIIVFIATDIVISYIATNFNY